MFRTCFEIVGMKFTLADLIFCLYLTITFSSVTLIALPLIFLISALIEANRIAEEGWQ